MLTFLFIVLRKLHRSLQKFRSWVKGKRYKGAKVQVYTLVSSVKRHSPDFTQWFPSYRTMFVHKPSQLPEEHIQWVRLPFSAQGTVFKHTSLPCPTRYPLTPGSRECTYEQSALPRSTTSEQRSRDQTRDLSYKLYIAHATTDRATTPHHIYIDLHLQRPTTVNLF